MPSNLVCMHVVTVLVATLPGRMDKFVIRKGKATSQGTKRAIADSQDSSDSDSELQPPEKVVATESGRVRASRTSYPIMLHGRRSTPGWSMTQPRKVWCALSARPMGKYQCKLEVHG